MKHLFLTIFILAAAFCSSAQTVTTSDSALNAGAAGSVTYNAPGSNSGNLIVAAKSGGGSLWQLTPSPWGISSGSGSIKMSYSGTGSISTVVSLTGLNNTAVNAYPFIWYGSAEYGTSGSINGQPPKFPAQLSAMSSLVADVSYSFTGSIAGTGDVLWDEWLIPTASYSGGNGGSVECEILLYNLFSLGSPTKTFTEPITVNGVTTNMVFNEYSSGTGAGNVTFLPASGAGISSGEVRFSLLDFFNEAAKTNKLTGWWISGIELGTEFGSSSKQNFTFTVTKLDIEQATGTASGPPTAPQNVAAKTQ